MPVLIAEIPLWVSIVSITLSGIAIVLGITLGILIIVRQREVARWKQAGITITKGPVSANYRGHASMNLPVKGNGVLAITDSDLRFVRFLPRSEFVIPLNQITSLEHRQTWKGSYRSHPVLVIHYRDSDRDEAVGFIVRNPADWSAALAQVTSVPAP